MRANISIAGDRQLSRDILRITEHVADLRPALNAIADQLRDANRRQFESEGRFGSGGWDPLSADYARAKARSFPGRPILVRTGALRRSLTERPFGVEEIGRQTMEVGSDLVYAQYHQHGTRKMPRRRPVELPASVRADMTRTLQRYIISGRV